MIRAAFCLLLLAAARAEAAAPADVLARIDAAARATKTLAAEFVQKNRMKLFKQELRSQGRLYFEAPRRIRWEYTAPDPSVLILDGQKATMRSPGTAPQVFDLDKDATMRAVFDQLLTFVGGGSLADLSSTYGVRVEGKPSAPTLVLTPEPGGAIAKSFARIELDFDAALAVRAIRLVERNGDEKQIVFTKLARNRALPAHAFE